MTETPDLPAQPLPPAKAPVSRAGWAVMILMGLDILLGLGIAGAGHFLLENDGIALVGAALATIGVLVMLFFQLWGDKR